MYNNQRYVRKRPAAVYEACAADAENGTGGQNGGCDQVYAMAYVKPQKFGEVYSEEEALLNGTLFPALCLPYTGGGR